MTLNSVVGITLAVAAVVSAFSTANAANLIQNGSFERPITPDGGFIIKSRGQRIGAWRIVGEEGEVGVIDKNYIAAGGFACPPRHGKQWLDLTPRATVTPTAIGVQQKVTTTPGQDYILTFFVGNVYDTVGQLGTTSTVDVFVDGEKVMSAINRGGRRHTSVVWQQFSLTLTAARATTTIAFINGDHDDLNGLDRVSLIPAP
jgi:hypothetical protein